MATYPQAISIAIANSNTILYNPFVQAGTTRAMVISMHLCNTTAADITVDIFLDKATDVYIADDKVVPAKGNLDWTGIIVIEDGAHDLVAIASAAGVQATGCVMEFVP